MSVDREEVQRIARLARLRLEDPEVERLTEEMSRILEHAQRLLSTGTDSSLDLGAGEEVPVEGMAGVRSEPAFPDPLDIAPEVFAPAWVDDFFVVPPPPGVTADVQVEGKES